MVIFYIFRLRAEDLHEFKSKKIFFVVYSFDIYKRNDEKL